MFRYTKRKKKWDYFDIIDQSNQTLERNNMGRWKKKKEKVTDLLDALL